MAARKPPAKRKPVAKRPGTRKFDDGARVSFLRRMEDSTAYHGVGTVVRYRPRKRDYVVRPDNAPPGTLVFFDTFELEPAPTDSVAPVVTPKRAPLRVKRPVRAVECPSESGGSEGGAT